MTTTQRLLCGLLLCGAALQAQSSDRRLAQRLDAALKAAGVPIVGVSILDPADRRTWKVQPATLQASAQALIDTFNPNDPALDVSDLDASVKAALDDDRLASAIVWAVLDTYSPPATIAKYQAARNKIILAYKGRPWLP